MFEVAARWREHVDIAALAPREARAIVHEFLGDVPFYELGSSRGRQAAGGPLLALEYVKRAVEATTRRPPPADVLVAASHFLPDAAALASLVRHGALGVAYVYHLVATRTDHSLRTIWSKGDERVGLALLGLRARIIFSSNAATAAALRRRGFDPVATTIGIDVGSFVQANPRELPPRAVFLARLARTKGVRDAVQAWARVRNAVPGARLVMVGTGPEREPAAALAERIGISDAIEWRGFVSEAEKRRILADSRVLLAPSYEEGWGIAVCEALASGVPVVAYRHHVLDEVFGAAYAGANPGDVETLADLAVRVLTDARYAEELTEIGRKTAERYDVGGIAEQELETILRARCGS